MKIWPCNRIIFFFFFFQFRIIIRTRIIYDRWSYIIHRVWSISFKYHTIILLYLLVHAFIIYIYTFCRVRFALFRVCGVQIIRIYINISLWDIYMQTVHLVYNTHESVCYTERMKILYSCCKRKSYDYTSRYTRLVLNIIYVCITFKIILIYNI